MKYIACIYLLMTVVNLLSICYLICSLLDDVGIETVYRDLYK